MPFPSGKDTLVYAHSISGYFRCGVYSVEKTTIVPLGVSFEPIHSAQDSFSFQNRLGEQGLIGSLIQLDREHVAATTLVIHYSLLLGILVFAFFGAKLLSRRT